MNKILLIQQNWLGDALFSTPAIRAIRKKYPAAHISCLVPARAAGALKNNPNVNETILYNDRAPLFSPSFWRTVFLLRGKKFGAAIFFHRSKTKAWIARLAGIRERWGFATPGRKAILTRAVGMPAEKLHKIDFFLYLAASLGIAPDGRWMEFVPDPAAVESLAQTLSKNGVMPGEPYAVVHAGGNWGLKRWPSDYFSQWIYYYLESHPGKVILCGTGREEGIAKKILEKFTDGRVVSLCGKTSTDELALLLKGATMLLSNDSGPIHLAATQKTRILGVFGPTSEAETGPVSEAPAVVLRKDVGCRVPCYFEACNYRVCMDFLLPQEVFAESEKLLSGA